MAVTSTSSSLGVERALAAVADTQSQLYEDQATLADRTGDLDHQLRVLGMELRRADIRVDRDLIGRLYWEAPSLSTQAIFEAFGLYSPNQVSVIAGKREFHLPCRDCETVLSYTVKNRTQLRKLRGRARCQPCQARLDERERERGAELRADWEQRNRDEEAAVQRAMQAYVLAHSELPEQPDGASMYIDIPVPEWGGTTVSLSALDEVRAELRDRLRNRNEPD